MLIFGGVLLFLLAEKSQISTATTKISENLESNLGVGQNQSKTCLVGGPNFFETY